MASITLGTFRDYLKAVADWANGLKEPKVQLSGSNVPQRIAAAVKETRSFGRSGLLAANTEEVLVDLPGAPLHLEAFTMGTDMIDMAANIYPYNASGQREELLRIPNKAGTALLTVTPRNLQDNANGENDFFKVFVYDTTNSRFAIGMKRQAVFGNGIRITIRNWDPSAARNVAAYAVLSILYT